MSPESAVGNLVEAYRQRDFEEYSKLLAPEFIFKFQPVDVQQVETEFWTRHQDTRGTYNLFKTPLVSHITINLTYEPAVPAPVSDFPPGTMWIRISQTLLEVDQIDGITWFVQDVQDMYFRRGDERYGENPAIWFLLEWRDVQPPDSLQAAAGGEQQATWGWLKTLYRRPPPLPPSDPPDSLPPTSPENVLFNFAEAVKANRIGLVYYAGTLAEEFELQLDAIDALAIGRTTLCKAADIDAQRTRADELDFLMTDSDTLSFVFGPVSPELTDTTAFYMDIPYELQVVRSESDTSIVSGIAEILLVENEVSLRWKITSWIDKRVDPFLSFGRWHGDRAVVECP